MGFIVIPRKTLIAKVLPYIPSDYTPTRNPAGCNPDVGYRFGYIVISSCLPCNQQPFRLYTPTLYPCCPVVVYSIQIWVHSVISSECTPTPQPWLQPPCCWVEIWVHSHQLRPYPYPTTLMAATLLLGTDLGTQSSAQTVPPPHNPDYNTLLWVQRFGYTVISSGVCSYVPANGLMVSQRRPSALNRRTDPATMAVPMMTL